jgi:CO dehydrogenase maturation factor
MHAALHESNGVDLIVMGRQEGPGCYCALNNILRGFLDQLVDDYQYIVVDNEAGMEHLSRRNTKKIDLLLVVSDNSMKAVRAAWRINELVDELKLEVNKKFLVLNRFEVEELANRKAEIEKTGLPLLAVIPADPKILQADAQGQSLVRLPSDTSFMQAFKPALDKIFKNRWI